MKAATAGKQQAQHREKGIDMIYGLILAGGIGQRMGSDIPKQFLELGGRAVLSYSVQTFLACELCDRVLVLVPAGWKKQAEEILYRDLAELTTSKKGGVEEAKSCSARKENPLEKVDILTGGALRNDTILQGIEYIKENLPFDEETILVTHDAARPFVTARMIKDSIIAMERNDACVTAIPTTDTIIEVRPCETKGEIQKKTGIGIGKERAPSAGKGMAKERVRMVDVPHRSHMYQEQTPQTFRMLQFEILYRAIPQKERKELTESAQVFLQRGLSVGVVAGSSHNIKITRREDLKIAEGRIQGFCAER